MNGAVDLGQLEGGVLFGIGQLLQEEVLIAPNKNTSESVSAESSPQPGRNMSSNTWEYKVPMACNVPRVFNVSLLKDSINGKADGPRQRRHIPPSLIPVPPFSRSRRLPEQGPGRAAAHCRARRLRCHPRGHQGRAQDARRPGPPDARHAADCRPDPARVRRRRLAADARVEAETIFAPKLALKPLGCACQSEPLPKP